MELKGSAILIQEAVLHKEGRPRLWREVDYFNSSNF